MSSHKPEASFPALGRWPVPARVLATAIIAMMALGLAVASLQVTVHDIIPTIQKLRAADHTAHAMSHAATAGHSDLFSDIFGMSGIFIVMGLLAAFLDKSARLRCWLIALPFAGILIDLLGVWLKLFLHPAFFWLHIPGGLMFSGIFVIESSLMVKEMWFSAPSVAHSV